MTDKEKLIKIKSLADKMYDTAFNLTTDASLLRKAMDDYHQFIINEYHKEEPVSEECIYNRTLEEKQKSCKFCSAACQVRIKEEPVSEELEEAAEGYAVTDEVLPNGKVMINFQVEKAFKAGAKWQKENLWKPADGDDLPEIDREVIVLIKYNTQRNIHDKEYSTYKVGFGHRPNPDGWDGKNIDTNEVTHYTPKLYDKGGWNAPDIVYWLDIELPKEIEL